MKKSKRKIIIFIIGVVIILYVFFFKNSNLGYYFQDEIVFFKLFSQGDRRITKSNDQINLNNICYFQVLYKNIDFKNIYLSDTINKKTLIREKIAPRNKRFF